MWCVILLTAPLTGSFYPPLQSYASVCARGLLGPPGRAGQSCHASKSQYKVLSWLGEASPALCQPGPPLTLEPVVGELAATLSPHSVPWAPELSTKQGPDAFLFLLRVCTALQYKVVLC